MKANRVFIIVSPVKRRKNGLLFSTAREFHRATITQACHQQTVKRYRMDLSAMSIPLFVPPLLLEWVLTNPTYAGSFTTTYLKTLKDITRKLVVPAVMDYQVIL